MSLKGLVEDEAGNPINDVTLHVRKGRFDLLSESFHSSSESKVELDDGKFRQFCFRCSTMRLFFRKKGFYAETVNFSNKTQQTTESQPRNALRIVLRRDWTVRLNGYYAYLRSNSNGPVTIAPIRRDLGNNVPLAALKQRPDRKEGFIPGYIQLNVKNLHGDETIEIDFSNVEGGGGAILYKYSKESPSKIFPSMKTAPTDGYQETLILSREQRGGGYYFYCRIGGIYGKGRIANPTLKSYENQKVMFARLELKLNHDGTTRIALAK